MPRPDITEGPLLARHRPDGTLWLTLNRPEVRNALSPELTGRLMEEFSAIDDSARLVVISGAGGAFCAGGDLAALKEAARGDYADAHLDGIAFDRMFRLVDTCPCPVIAAVDGPALGGGTGLACCADLVIATSRASFGCTEVRVGIIPAIVAPYVLAKVGSSHARRMLLSGERFDAGTGHEVGLVDEVTEPGHLEAAVEAAIKRYLGADPVAQRATKRLLRLLSGGVPAELGSAFTALETARVRVSPEGRRGLAAMLAQVGSGRRDERTGR